MHAIRGALSVGIASKELWKLTLAKDRVESFVAWLDVTVSIHLAWSTLAATRLSGLRPPTISYIIKLWSRSNTACCTMFELPLATLLAIEPTKFLVL